MPSFILLSRDQVPWVALRLLTVAVLAWASSAAYALYLNPEIAFFKHGARLKHAWAEKLNREYTRKVVVFGGSSCGVSIDGERMLDHHGLPTVNMGLGAGMGADPYRSPRSPSPRRGYSHRSLGARVVDRRR